MVKHIDQLTEAQRAQFDRWADRWIEIGLRTAPANREQFETAARECYRHAKIPWPRRVVWVSSPIAIAIAAPTAALLIQMQKKHDAVGGAVRDAVGDAVGDAVDGAVGGAVRDAVGDAVGDAVDGAVGGAVRDAVRGAVDDAVDDAVGDAVDGAVGGAVGGAVRDAVIRKAVANAISRMWNNYLGGQFWVGGWYWGGALTSFFREICDLELPNDLWARGIAYEQTMQSACWWYPHRDFVMACERPVVIHRELVNPDRSRGWGSHRLHCNDGPAIAWPDGWGIYAVHGVRIPAWIIERPQEISVSRIDSEQNAEIRRIMIQRFGVARYVRESGADCVHSLPDNYYLRGLQDAKLYRKVRPGDSDLVMIAVKNSTPEPDGTIKDYFLRVEPAAYDGLASRDCHAAMASTWRYEDGSLVFQKPSDYSPRIET